MLPLRWKCIQRAKLVCGALFLVAYFQPAAHADGKGQKKESTSSVPLQPFFLSPPTAKATPRAKETAPRILKAIKAEPVRVAYFKDRQRKPRTPSVHGLDDYDQLEDSSGDSVRIAYQTARAIPVRKPDPENVGNDESAEDQPNEDQVDPQISGSRDHGIVSGKQ